MRAGIVYIKVPISEILTENISDDVTLLKESIKTYGLLQPVGIVPFHDKYKLIFGSRRLKACKELDQKYIHAVLLSVREDEEKYLSYVENIHRSEAADALRDASVLRGCDLKNLLCLSHEQTRFIGNYLSLNEDARKKVNAFTSRYVNPAFGDSKYFLRMVELEKNIPVSAKEKVRLSVLSDKRIFINEIEKIVDLMRMGGHSDTVFEDGDKIVIKKTAV